MRILVPAAVAFFSMIGTAQAGTITAVGAVKALNDISQMQNVIGKANFDEGPLSGPVPLGLYSAQGLTWQIGSFASILPGVTQVGTAVQPQYDSMGTSHFVPPIAGGGTQTYVPVLSAGVATFSGNVTQVGLTASGNGITYVTAWSQTGAMLGQIKWEPSSQHDAAFIGIDTMGVPVGMVAFGNDDVYGGIPYNITGFSIISDSWVWAGGKCTTSVQCDDGNPCTDDTCDPLGACTHTNNTAPCSDNNACTQNDTCSGGSCVPGSPITCVAMDQCHGVGTCDTTTGTCSNPTKPDSTACNDGDACTQTDTCKAGVCTGANSVACAAQDQCHVAGVCNPMTGMCSNPTKADGSACNDSNACTQTDTCQAGVCSGMSPVVCPPPDQCHGAGTCDATTGMCSNPAKADGSACDDGNACTQTDTCHAGACMGGNPVNCTAMDQCHEVGLCDTTTGQCSKPLKVDGVACDDGDKCTTGDTCQGGTCQSGTPVDCSTPPDACHLAGGMCQSANGTCVYANAPKGTSCPGGTCDSVGKCIPDSSTSSSSTSSSTTSGAGGAGGATTSTGAGGGATTSTGAGGESSSSVGGSGPGPTTGGGAGMKGGCGCRAAGDERSAAGGAVGLLLLGLSVARKRRRAGARGSRTMPA